ncbi:MAG: GIY-YIG nuclease family protein [Nitrospirota bacterium]|nr:GIY-YIG nuclease family protein [Nitrospirota bacterium]
MQRKYYKREKYYCVYISTNKTHNVLYTGVTNNLLNRDDQHRKKFNKKSFTATYNVNKVVYYETFTDIRDAIAREKQIKGWVRKKKLELIRSINPGWKNLVEESWK